MAWCVTDQAPAGGFGRPMKVGKEEMMGTLKNFGNKILGNFGLSTDNFQMTPQDGGGYSVNFVQNQDLNKGG